MFCFVLFCCKRSETDSQYIRNKWRIWLPTTAATGCGVWCSRRRPSSGSSPSTVLETPSIYLIGRTKWRPLTARPPRRQFGHGGVLLLSAQQEGRPRIRQGRERDGRVPGLHRARRSPPPPCPVVVAIPSSFGVAMLIVCCADPFAVLRASATKPRTRFRAP